MPSKFVPRLSRRGLSHCPGVTRSSTSGWRESSPAEEIEAKNAKLKRMFAELALENTAIKDVLSP